jgi:hypothetical protein
LIPDTTLIALTHQATIHSELLTQQLTQGWDADTIVTSLLPSLHEQADSALSALAFVSVTGAATQPEIEPVAETDLTSSLLPELKPESEPETAVPSSPSFRQPLAPSRRTLGTAPRFTVPPNISSGLTLALKKVVQWSLSFGSHLRHTSKVWQHSWQQTLPKAKQQIIIAIIGLGLALSLLISGLVWFVHTKKSLGNSTANQTSAATPNSTTQNQPQELPVFFDLRLTEPNFLANRVIVAGSAAYFADLENKKIIQLDLTKKQSNLLPLGALTKLTDITLSGQFLYLLGGGLNRWDTQPASATAPAAKNLKAEGDSDRDGTLLGSFGSYLYVLNPAKRNIFRFAVDKQDKVSDPVGWLVNKKGLDFPQLVSFAIDGDVWLTDKTGHVFKFTQGQPVDWQLNGLKTPLDSPVYAVTNDSLTKLYLLEPNHHRLLIIEKTGQLVKEIESPTLAAVTSLGVSESLQKAFAVSGSTVYEIQL